MKKSGKIIIKPRKSKQDMVSLSEPEDEQLANEDNNDGDNDDNDEEEDDAEEDADADAPEDSLKDDDAPIDSEPDPTVPVIRGRPRGRPRGTGAGASAGRGGTGRPRGRPRGSGRGRARGRPRGSITLKLPKRLGGPGGDTSDAGNDEAFVDDENGGGGEPVVEVYVPVRKVVPPIEGDTYVSPDDPKGDTKIDQNGVLLGNRQFKASTFVLPARHPERRYMLAIDAARTSGFRDSLYYFRRNPLAYKLNATQPEKDYLIEQGKLGGHLRTRSVTLVTARSAFKLHGAKTLVDGRIGVDDYYEEKAIAEAEARGLRAGDLASELIEQQQAAVADASAAAGKAERSGLGLYRTGGPTTVFGGSGLGPYSDGPLNVAKKAMLTREGASDENWMLVMAQRTSEANSEWLKGRVEAVRGVEELVDANANGGEDAVTSRNKRSRRDQPGVVSSGVHEPHTSVIHYESSTQPTQARWEPIPHSTTVLGGTKVGNGAWGLAWVDTVMELEAAAAESIETRPRPRAVPGFLQFV